MPQLDRDSVIKILQSHIDELHALGVQSISIFGSVARGEAHAGSDVDLLVDLAPGITLFGMVRLQDRLESLLEARVDLVPRDGIKRQLRDRILGEAVRAA